jgi:hypothetical protein
MNDHSVAKRGPSRPDVKVSNLSEAADRIIGCQIVQGEE